MVKAREEYTKHHKRWLSAWLARDKEDTEAQNAGRVEVTKLMNDAGRELFFQKTIRKLLLDVMRMVNEIKEEKVQAKAYHETHCLGVNPQA